MFIGTGRLVLANDIGCLDRLHVKAFRPGHFDDFFDDVARIDRL